MKSRFALIPVALISALSLSACAENYAAEGGLGGAALGAGVAADHVVDIVRQVAPIRPPQVPGHAVDRLDDVSDPVDDREDGIDIDIHLPQEDLGRSLGASRQGISRELKQWEARGWLALDYGRLRILNTEALSRIADGHATGR